MLSTERNFVIVFLVVFFKIDQGIHCLDDQTIDNILSLSTRNRFTPANSSTQQDSLRDTYPLHYRGNLFKSLSPSIYYRGDSFRSGQSADVSRPPVSPERVGSFLKIVYSSQYDYYVKKEPYAIIAFILKHKNSKSACELLEQLKCNTDYKDITLFLVDIDEGLNIANTFGVNSVPTLISFRQGEKFEILPPSNTQDKNLIENMFINLLNKDKQEKEEPQQTATKKVEKKVTFNDTTEYKEEPQKTTDIATTKNETIETSNNTTKNEEPKKWTTTASSKTIEDDAASTSKKSIKKTLSKLSSTSAGTSISECKTKILNFYKERKVPVKNDNILIINSIKYNFKLLDFYELDSNDVNSAIPDSIDSNEQNSVDNLKLKEKILTHLSLTTITKKTKKRSKLVKTVKNIIGQKNKIVSELLGEFFDYTFQVALCGFHKIKNKLETGKQFCDRVSNGDDAQKYSCLTALMRDKYPLDDVGVSLYHAFFIMNHAFTLDQEKRYIRKGFSFDYEAYIEKAVVSSIKDDCYRIGNSVEEYCTKLPNISKT